MSTANNTPHWLYTMIKERYDSIVPIRGKRASEDIRPVDNRTRTHERVVKVERADGTWYGFRLYNTDVVLVSSEGVLEFDHGNWVTPSTASFMHQCGLYCCDRLFRAYKQDNKIWIVPIQDEWLNPKTYAAYPLVQATMQFKVSEDQQNTTIVPMQEIVEHVPAIIRKEMNKYMAPLKPMIAYIETMLKLSDNTVYSDTYETFGYIDSKYSWNNMYSYKLSTGDVINDRTFATSSFGGNADYELCLNIAQNGTTEDWTKVMCSMVTMIDRQVKIVGGKMLEVKYENGTVHNVRFNLRDIKVIADLKAIRNRFASIVKKHKQEVWTTKPKTWG